MKRIFSMELLFMMISISISPVFVFKILSSLGINILSIFIAFIGLFVLLSLIYLSYYDLKRMEVHNFLSISLIAFLFCLNLSLFILNGSDSGFNVSNNFIFNPYENFLGALILGTIFQLVVLISKEKALGQGDVRIAIIVGLLIGYSNIILWLYITTFSAIFYALFLGIKKRKFKGLQVPFVPFMVLGSIVILLLSL